MNWAGDKCDIRWTDPDKFDIKTYMEELPASKKSLLQGIKTSPKLLGMLRLYLMSFQNQRKAKYPIVTISVCSPDCNVIILGTRDLGIGGETYLESNFQEYIDKLAYFKKLGMKMPSIKYIKFSIPEHDMLIYFSD